MIGKELLWFDNLHNSYQIATLLRMLCKVVALSDVAPTSTVITFHRCCVSYNSVNTDRTGSVVLLSSVVVG